LIWWVASKPTTQSAPIASAPKYIEPRWFFVHRFRRISTTAFFFAQLPHAGAHRKEQGHFPEAKSPEHSGGFEGFGQEPKRLAQAVFHGKILDQRMARITCYLDWFAPSPVRFSAMDEVFFRISKRNGLRFLLLFLPLSLSKGGEVFNSLKYVKKLEDAGIPREQAETHIQIVTEIMETSLATKQDIKDLQAATRQDIKDLQAATRQSFKDLRAATQQTFQEMHLKMEQGFQELRQEMKYDLSLLDQKIIQSEQRMTIKLGTIVSLAIGVAVALAKIIA
jgi:hypothetical protein